MKQDLPTSAAAVSIGEADTNPANDVWSCSFSLILAWPPAHATSGMRRLPRQIHFHPPRFGLPPLFGLFTARVHDAPFARPLLELAVRLFALCPRVIRLDAAYWSLKLIAWIHTTLGAAAVIPCNPKR